MLYPIIRRIRRPLLPSESRATPPAAELTQTMVEQPPVVPAVQDAATTVTAPSMQPEPEPPVAPLAPTPPVTETKPKRAKVAEQKSRKLVEPGA